MWEQETEVEPFRVTLGFIAFVTALFLPVLIALAVFAGAALVSGDVYAAREQQDGTAQSSSLDDVPGWKQTLVGICPLH